MGYRKIRKIVSGTPAVDGAGVHLVRVLGHRDVEDFDPFLLLDAFDSTNPKDYLKGFPWHPHRGIETVTFLVAGDIEHGDSLGNKGSILDGGCQWMTAGSGIVHQEMPQAAPRMLGLQLWINMPAARKMIAPKYGDLPRESIPVAEEPGARIAVVGGAFRECAGAKRGENVDATLLDLALEPGASLEIPLPPGDTAFVYILDGEVSFDAPEALAFQERRRAVLLSGGDAVRLTAAPSASARCVLCSGAPLKESIAWGGPIVMNTPDELETAFRELDEGTFLKQAQPEHSRLP